MAHYDTSGFSTSYNTVIPGNILNRIVNLLIQAINTHVLLPKAVIIVLDDDMLDELNHYKSGITRSIGEMIEWIFIQIHRIVTAHKEQLPSKSRKFKYPTILWCLIPCHKVYNHYNEYKSIFNKAIIDTVKLFREMSYLELKAWNPDNLEYFTAGTINPQGFSCY